MTLSFLLQQQFTQLSHAVAKASYFHQQEDQGIDMTQVSPKSIQIFAYGADLFLMRLQQVAFFCSRKAKIGPINNNEKNIQNQLVSRVCIWVTV
jgi:hypothetical protein